MADGRTTTSQDSTTGSLSRSTTSCVIPQDHSAYWFPTLQCDTHGYDLYLPQFGSVLGPNYQLLSQG